MNDTKFIYPKFNVTKELNSETGGQIFYIRNNGNNMVQAYSENLNYEKPKYLKDVDRLINRESYFFKEGKFIIIGDNDNEKRRVARYIEDSEACYIQQRDEKSSFYDDVYIELSDNMLIELDLDIKAEGKEINPTAYARVVNRFARKDSSLFVKGLNNKKYLEEKINAVENVEAINKFISLPKSMENDAWVDRLSRFEGYKKVVINDVDKAYYISVIDRLLEREGVGLDSKINSKELFGYISRISNNQPCEENIEKIIMDAKAEASYRADDKLTLEDFNFKKADEKSAKEKIQGLIGMEEPKRLIVENFALMKEQSKNPNLKESHGSMIFVGNPGTGKSTTALLYMEYLKEAGLKGGECILAKRSDVVAGYLGQTSLKVERLFNEAHDGVLFFEEAGWMINPRPGDYTDEAIKNIVTNMELYPDVTCVFAMYKREANELLKVDEGLSSRISKIVEFRDYTPDELLKIADYMFTERGYRLADGLDEKIAEYMNNKKLLAKDTFGNAREVRKLVESCITAHAVRTMDDDRFDADISADDLDESIARLDMVLKSNNSYGFSVAS